MIDNYVDVNTLNILCKKNKGVDVVITTAGKGSLSTKDAGKKSFCITKIEEKDLIMGLINKVG